LIDQDAAAALLRRTLTMMLSNQHRQYFWLNRLVDTIGVMKMKMTPGGVVSTVTDGMHPLRRESLSP
jgi:hypothetical protein